MARKAKATAVVTAPVVAPVGVAQATALQTQNGGVRGNWHGYTVCGLLRAMGYAGYTAKQGAALLAAVGLPGTSPSTVGCQVGAGRQYARGVAAPHHIGSITPLAGAVLAQVVQAVGQPANPHASIAPLPAPRTAPVGVVQAPAPAPVVPPTPAPAKPRKGTKTGK